MTKNASILEMVMFKTKPEFSNAQVVESAKKAEKIIQNYNGYLGRTLAYSEEKKEWTDIVFWENLEQAEYAAKEVMQNEICLQFFGMIDESSMTFQHLNILI